MQKKSNRMQYLDNIKWVLAIIVIMHHSFDYFRNVYSTHYDAFSHILCFNQSYFMDLFFFISAFFIIPSFLNKGKSVFIKDKFIRLGGAVLIGSILVNSIKGLILYSDKITLSGFISWYYQKIKV